MQVYSMQSFSGRNIYSHRPVIKMVINIGDLYHKETKEIEGFNENLLKLFPGLNKHYCSRGYEGGFVERLAEGTYIGHVTEHLILELQSLMGYEVYYGKTRLVSEPSVYYIIFEYVNEKCAVECGKAAVDIVSCLVDGKIPDTQQILNNIRKIVVEYELGPSTKAIVDEARKRGIPVTRVGNESLIQLGYGKYSRLVQASLTDAPNCISVDIASNKHLTKQILRDHMIPVPDGDVVDTEQSAVSLARSIGYPVALKPYDGNQGKGVALNLRSEDQVKEAFQEAMKHSKAVIIEKYIKGKDYRILVVGDKVSAVAERRPPCVVGDGMHTIKELVDMENDNPLRGDDHEKPLTKMKLDHVAKQMLGRSGLDEHYVPAANEVVNLRDNGNLSTGGTARDCTNEIHPYNCEIAIKAAKAIGLDIAGIDMTMEDISQPLSHTNGAVIEVNAAPGLRMHLYPTQGEAVNVAADIIDMMYPQGHPYSIPVVSITGTNGKTTTTRLVAHTLTLMGKTVGMTSTSGVYIGSQCILKGDNTGPISAKMVLSNKEVEVAVLETARGGIVRKGLGYDLADVGVITNLSEDHIGLDGLDTLEDLAYVKSLVIEAVKPNGCAVLNADDKMVKYLMKRAAGEVILFSKEHNNPLVLQHISAGGKAVIIKNSIIYVHDRKNIIPLLDAKDIPITFNGVLECNIENSLAAISTLYSLKIPIDVIQKGLKTFKPDVVSNPGRFNIFDMGNYKVMLDYSHNPAGYNAVVSFIRKLDDKSIKRMIGVIGMPGDRLDRSIRQVGEICSKAFSKIYIKEDSDLRNREPGEVAGILYDAVLTGGCDKEKVEIIYSELRALETAMTNARPGDLIIMFYEHFEPSVDLINKIRQKQKYEAVECETVEEETAS